MVRIMSQRCWPRKPRDRLVTSTHPNESGRTYNTITGTGFIVPNISKSKYGAIDNQDGLKMFEGWLGKNERRQTPESPKSYIYIKKSLGMIISRLNKMQSPSSWPRPLPQSPRLACSWPLAQANGVVQGPFRDAMTSASSRVRAMIWDLDGTLRITMNHPCWHRFRRRSGGTYKSNKCSARIQKGDPSHRSPDLHPAC